MKSKDLGMTVLFDFYGEILTEKQRQVIDLYYNDDLSLAEIAEQAGITRQGVRDCIKRGEATMRFMEEKLRLARRFSQVRQALEEIESDAARIREVNERYCFSRDVGRLAEQIADAAHRIDESAE